MIGLPKKLIQSLFFRVNKLLKASYRPAGVCSVRDLSDSSLVHCYKIKEANTVEKVKCSEYEGENVFYVLDEGRLDTDHGRNDAVITKENRLVSELSFQYSEKLKKYTFDGNDNNIFHRYFLSPKPLYLDGIAFSAIAGGSTVHNYYHWLVESFPKFLLIKDTDFFKQIDYFLIPNPSSPYKRQTLELLGIPYKKVVDTLGNSNIIAKQLVINKHPSMYEFTPTWVLKMVRDFVLSKIENNRQPSNLIYISRNRSRKRMVLNEEELMTRLKPLGFEKYELEELSLLEQVSLFNSAQIIVAPHGAGLGNILFCNNNVRIIELFPPGSFHKHYKTISQKLDFNYLSVVSDKVYDRDLLMENVDNGLHEDFEANLDTILHTIN